MILTEGESAALGRWELECRTEGQGRAEGDVRGDEVWSGVGLVRVLPVRRTDTSSVKGTI